MPAASEQNHQQQQQQNGGASSAISTQVVHLLREYTGRGPTKAKTYIDHELVTVVLRDILTKGERSLVNDGKTEAVLKTRQLYQETMRDDLVATVERVTGRKVTAFMSANHISPDMAVET